MLRTAPQIFRVMVGSQMVDRHKKREISVFQAFAQICDLSIERDSIVKMDPPKPDIQCKMKGGKQLAFELVEVIGPGVANSYKKQAETKKELIEFHTKLPHDKKIIFEAKFSNAMIFPKFKNDCTLRQRKKLFPIIIDHLLTLDDQFEGDTFKNTPKYGNKLSLINVKRCQFDRFIFDLPPGGSFGDTATSAIDSKFQKSYESDHSIHLLAYIELNPMPPKDIWISSVKEYVKGSIIGCQFQKVWIFDLINSTIEFEYP